MCPVPNDQGPAQVSKAKVSKAQQRGASASLNYKLTLGTVFGFKIPVPSAECIGKPNENERKMRWGGDAIKVLHFKKEKFSLWPKANLQATGSSGLRAKLHTPPRHTPKQRPPPHTKPYHLSPLSHKSYAQTCIYAGAHRVSSLHTSCDTWAVVMEYASFGLSFRALTSLLAHAMCHICMLSVPLLMGCLRDHRHIPGSAIGPRLLLRLAVVMYMHLRLE